MTATFTPDKLTPMTPNEVVEPMRWALGTRLEGEESVNDGVLALAMAKCALETARFKAVHCWNFGNIKASKMWEGMFTCFPCGEILHGQDWRFTPEGWESCRALGINRRPVAYQVPPGHPQTRFCAWANQFDGCDFYVDFIAKRPALWAALLTGDPAEYVAALKRARYFTADETVYRTGVINLYGAMLGVVRGVPASMPTDVDVEEIRRIIITKHPYVLDPFERGPTELT